MVPTLPPDPPPKRPLLVGWVTALGALLACLGALALALWLLRAPVAEFILKGALADRGAEADFKIARLGWGGAVLTDIRFGAEASPDVAIERIEARWDWRGLAPRLRSLRLVEPRLRLRMDRGGRVSAGSLDRLRSSPSGRRPSVPRIGLVIENGQALIEAPFGAIPVSFRSSGEIGHDFSGLARINQTSRHAADYALDQGEGELLVVSRDANIGFRLTLGAAALEWAGAHAARAQFTAIGRAPLDLSRYDFETAWRALSLRTPNLSAEALAGALGAEALARADGLEPSTFEGEAHLTAGRVVFADNSAGHARFDSHFNGHDAQGRGSWTLAAETFTGLSLTSARPNVTGQFNFDLHGDKHLEADALAILAQSRLDAGAQQDIRDAFPNMADAPIGPTFAQAEHALDAAADRFDLTIPLALHIDESALRITATRPVEARAASGVVLRLAPLRDDAPALVLQWPGASLHGAVALELSGGGAPTASLLFDNVDWGPDAPFEADGTLSISRWSANGASIATDNLGVSVSIGPRRGGHIDLDGPARITGPLGDGQIRDLVATLDVAVAWDAGWRVTPNHGCLPVSMGGLDAAGLSFASGAFALCPLHGALIAADANHRLSGGFLIQRLGLNGRMAGPAVRPARLSAGAITGTFGGATDDVTLAVEAASPALAIDMEQGRTFTIRGQRLIANARMGDSWRVDGLFDAGLLTDPALPGAVSAITGRWSAAPENDRAVIRVDAGEALLIANTPTADTERPLFHTLRMVDVAGELREGQINAQGGLVLEGRGRRLAQFTATHDVDQGVGSANVNADNIVFDQNLQPYEISEMARGVVENVRGPASGEADIAWTRDAIHATGIIRPNGLSLSTATIPVIQNVRGEVHFDDLFALTTPPGQQVTIGLVNPGIEVHDGRVRFQLLPERRVAIENAEFNFASGILSVSPTTLELGAAETRLELTLRDIDAAALIAQLNIPDLSATGQIEGRFPLKLDATSAIITGGVLRAQGQGGTISYTGDAGRSATGAARVAFDALQRFHYDALQLTLDGDLNDEVVSTIIFSGQNSGRPVDVTPIAGIPGAGRVTANGVPFHFNIRVTAPFRRLADTAATIVDPGTILDRGREQRQNEPPPVDQLSPAPR